MVSIGHPLMDKQRPLGLYVQSPIKLYHYIDNEVAHYNTEPSEPLKAPAYIYLANLLADGGKKGRKMGLIYACRFWTYA